MNEREGTGTVRATVVGRSCSEQLVLRTAEGGTLMIRVEGGLWAKLDLAQEVDVDRGADGAITALRPVR